MSDLRCFVMFRSITVEYSDDDMRCRILFNGRRTPIYAERSSYDDPFRIYVDHRPDSPVLTETKGWGVVGGISMIVDALMSTDDRREPGGGER